MNPMHEVNEDIQKGAVCALIVAAGKGARMGAERNKIFLDLCGKPVLVHTMERLHQSGVFSRFILVVNPEEEMEIRHMLAELAFPEPVAYAHGGRDRQESVWNGLQLLNEAAAVLIHDAARPFVPVETLRACARAVLEYGAACVGVPVKDTIKRVDVRGLILDTPEREGLWAVQTPQGFLPALIREAHAAAMQDGFRGTDDAMLVERVGKAVLMVMGSYRNIKLTTPEDMLLARIILEEGG